MGLGDVWRAQVIAIVIFKRADVGTNYVIAASVNDSEVRGKFEERYSGLRKVW